MEKDVKSCVGLHCTARGARWMEEVRPRKLIICSGSAAALMALQTGKSGARPDLMVEISQMEYQSWGSL